MKSSILGLLAFVLLAGPVSSEAGVIFETATMGPADHRAGASLASDSFIGGSFSLNATTNVTAIGGHLFGFGTLFGAIVSLESPSALPVGNPFALGEVLASTTFDGNFPSADVSVALSVTLPPGDYAVIFGSGLFGATGWGAMTDNNDPLGSQSLFRWDGDQSRWRNVQWNNVNPGETPLRFVVYGHDVSVPESTPIQYGLFIGANHPNDNAFFRFDRNAQDMGAAFDARPNTIAEVLTGDTETDPIRVADIERTLERLRRIMRPGDSLTLYINNHGDSLIPGATSFNGEGLGDEAIYVGDLLWDNALAAMLRNFDGFRVTVFLDTCHGGGFWGGTDSFELSPGLGFNDLNDLNNIALYAAAPEALEAYGVGRRSFWGTALLEAFRTPMSWSPAGLAQHLFQRTSSLASDTVNRSQYPVWYTAAYGEPVAPDMSLIETFSAHSTDYDFEGTLFGGPEVDQQFSEMLGLVEGVGPGTSLFDKVSEAQTYFESGDTYAACTKLKALTNQVTAQSGKKIPADRATSIHAHADFTMSALSCAEQL